MHQLLSQIESAQQLQHMSLAELNQLAEEIREVLVQSAEHAVRPISPRIWASSSSVWPCTACLIFAVIG